MNASPARSRSSKLSRASSRPAPSSAARALSSSAAASSNASIAIARSEARCAAVFAASASPAGNAARRWCASSASASPPRDASRDASPRCSAARRSAGRSWYSVSRTSTCEKRKLPGSVATIAPAASAAASLSCAAAGGRSASAASIAVEKSRPITEATPRSSRVSAGSRPARRRMTSRIVSGTGSGAPAPAAKSPRWIRRRSSSSTNSGFPSVVRAIPSTSAGSAARPESRVTISPIWSRSSGTSGR